MANLKETDVYKTYIWYFQVKVNYKKSKSYWEESHFLIRNACESWKTTFEIQIIRFQYYTVFVIILFSKSYWFANSIHFYISFFHFSFCVRHIFLCQIIFLYHGFIVLLFISVYNCFFHLFKKTVAYRPWIRGDKSFLWILEINTLLLLLLLLLILSLLLLLTMGKLTLKPLFTNFEIL